MTAQQHKAERVLAEALFNAPIWAEDDDGLQWPEDWREGERQVDAIARVVVAALPEPICTDPAHAELKKAARELADAYSQNQYARGERAYVAVRAALAALRPEARPDEQ